jgi:hypothetical protein
MVRSKVFFKNFSVVGVADGGLHKIHVGLLDLDRIHQSGFKTDTQSVKFSEFVFARNAL